MFLLAADGRECASMATLKDWSVSLVRGLASLASIFNPEEIILRWTGLSAKRKSLHQFPMTLP